MNANLIKLKGKPIEKLIETVSQGIGILYEPKRIRRKADAEAYRIEKIQEAQAKGLILKSDTEFEIIERAKERLAFNEINRQVNLESIVQKSISHLGDSVSDEPVDEDWRTRYFNRAQDISNEEMQEIWGKILAEEITRPGKISFRTLDILSNISKSEAKVFETACKLAFNHGMILKLNDEKNDLPQFGLSYNNLLMLRSAGLIYESDNLNVTFTPYKPEDGVAFKIGDYKIMAYKPDTDKYVFDQIKFTPAGEELMNILDIDKNVEYIQFFVDSFNKDGMNIKIVKE